MSKKLILALAVLSLFAVTPALADGKEDCTTDPVASWKPVTDAEAAAKTAGYEVRKSKTEGTCYEVYGVKDGKNYELFYHPVTLELLATEES